MDPINVPFTDSSVLDAAKAPLKRKASEVADEQLSLVKKVHRTRGQAKKEAASDGPNEPNHVIELTLVTGGGDPPTGGSQMGPTGNTSTPPTGLPDPNGDFGTPPTDPMPDDVLPLSPPSGQPPVSSDIRAALCDSINYWRAHQGGIQSNKMIATGMLLNGKTTPRDILQAQVIVTTVGGGLKTAADGGRIRKKDQSDGDKNYVTLKNAMNTGEPIGVVVGKQAQDKGRYVNNLLMVTVKNHFNVLAWFFITDIWSEYQPMQRDGTRFKQFVIRLQKIDLTSISWWVPQDNGEEDMYTVGEFHCHAIACAKCENDSKEIFQEGWCCLNKSCSEFFRFADPDVNVDNLHYSKNFLNERTEWNSEKSLEPLVPEFIQREANEFGSEERFKRGIICPNCLFASRRISWDGWACEKGCGFEVSMPPLDVPMTHIHSETDKVLARKAKYFQTDDRVMITKHSITGYEVTTFYLPNTPQNSHEGKWIGSVTIFHPTENTLERNGGLNELFQDVQVATRVGDVKLERHAAFCRGSHMEELTSHFSCNMGADYKFGVVVETSNGFDTAPAPVMRALSRLTWGGATAVALTAQQVLENKMSVDSASMPDQFVDFNEQLMLGYFEKSQISFHDDGEKELGPTVATLSLGSPAIMRFRSKGKSGMEDTIGANNVMLSFVLEHGDMVIMHGTKIHQHYEHAVTAAGIRRYALTCRYIRPEMIPDAERREKAVVNGKVPTFWQKQAYKGEGTEELEEAGDAVEYQVDAQSSVLDTEAN
ncbi:hypothetical protein F4861DRAFT_535882 [Xylaria intraflava]|nr:hypothetical protein F4861DRAFT_535882 [Xylaria intraflava]